MYLDKRKLWRNGKIKKGGKNITFITDSCSTLCEYVRRQAEDAKEKVCVRWNATVKFDPTGYKFLYDFVERNVYLNRSQLCNVMKNVRKEKKVNNDGGEGAFSIWREKHTRGDVRPLNELKITFYSTFRLALSHTCLYIYKNRRRFLNTWSRERAVFLSRLRYEKMGTCSMILCNATLRTHQTKKKTKKQKI